MGLVPKVLATRENYYLYPHTTAIVANQAAYRLPDRMIGQKLKAVELIDSSGNIIPVPQIAYEDRGLYQEQSTNAPVFYFQNNSVVLVPTPTSNNIYTLSIPFFIRPSTLVPVSSAARISAISGNQITVESLPSTITASELVDFIKHDSGFECAAINQSISSVSGTVLTMSSTPPSSLAVGDYVCLAGETPIPQVPAELHVILSLRVAVIILQALGFANEMKLMQAKLEEAENEMDEILSPRSDSNAKKINPRGGILRQRGR